MGFSVWSKPTLRPVSPLGGNTINRRAVCGRPACTVRRGEGPKPIGPSYPIGLIERNDALVHREDRDVSEALRELFDDEGIEVLTATPVARVEGRSGESVRLHATHGV